MTWLLLAVSVAGATPAFDPTGAAWRTTGGETWDRDRTVQLWSAVERLEDPETGLFHQEDFNLALEWPDSGDRAPWVRECFGTARPHSGTFLLHQGLGAATAAGTPVLLVPGAADTASDDLHDLAARLDAEGRPVWGLTFAHPHGDVLLQAEVVADAVARIRHLTGAAQVDVVAHSKGALAALAYTSHTAGARWGGHAYETHGTPYRGDVRRLVLVGAPLGGVDTSFRWPAGNLALTSAEAAFAPSSWHTWYPSGTSAWWSSVDLSAQDLLPDGGDLFPGQRQMLAPQDAPLPGSLAWLGSWTLQPDWWTTWAGGLGFQSDADGIEAAVAAGGDFLAHLAANGADPAVEIYLLAGTSPLLESVAEETWAALFGSAWTDLATLGTDLWATFLGQLAEAGLVQGAFTAAEVQGLAQGALVLGEVTGVSDGVLFLDSALETGTLDGRGARVVETRVAALNHRDLLRASPEAAAEQRARAAADPLDEGWREALAERWAAEDTLGWLVDVLAEPAATGDTGDTGGPDDPADDTGASDGDTGAGLDPSLFAPDACGCRATGAASLLPTLLGLAALLRRRPPWSSR